MIKLQFFLDIAVKYSKLTLSLISVNFADFH